MRANNQSFFPGQAKIHLERSKIVITFSTELKSNHSMLLQIIHVYLVRFVPTNDGSCMVKGGVVGRFKPILNPSSFDGGFVVL